jgi:hypothetical protein
MKINGVEIAERLVGTYNQALVGEGGVMGSGASTVQMLVYDLSRAEAQLASIKSEYEATALANGRLQAENQRLRMALSAAHAAGELGGWEGCRPEDNCACCDAWRGAKELRDAAIALPAQTPEAEHE